MLYSLYSMCTKLYGILCERREVIKKEKEKEKERECKIKRENPLWEKRGDRN